MPQVQQLWMDLINRLQEGLSPQSFDIWVRPLTPVSLSETALTIEVPNEFFGNWLRNHYLEMFKGILAEIIGQPLAIEFTVVSAPKEKVASPPPETMKKPSFPINRTALFSSESQLNPRYTFETFVVGSSNRFAHAASMAVAESPAQAYNPLFIYGGVGLGKTHLMQAIGHYILERDNTKAVLYISSEKFTNQLINAIQNRTTLRFRSKYRNVDALLIDDIHFLSGKEQTQEEFFHTFNQLYDSHKQIVLSSDRPPKDIANLEERLVSRFEWGLVTDLQIPDFETRIAILRKKADMQGFLVSEEIITFLADRIKSNIRKLEGALIRMVSYSSLTNSAISVTLAEDLLQDYFADEEERNITIDLIQKKVAEHFDIRIADMTSKKRPKGIVFPRQIAMYLARNLTNYSLPEIGEAFGGRDHTTVIHAFRLIENRMASDTSLRRTISYLTQKLKK